MGWRKRFRPYEHVPTIMLRAEYLAMSECVERFGLRWDDSPENRQWFRTIGELDAELAKRGEPLPKLRVQLVAADEDVQGPVSQDT